jgi:hypothetical protein
MGMPSARRFPPPWTIEEHNDACFIVKDHNGHALAFVFLLRPRASPLHQWINLRAEVTNAGSPMAENEPGRRAAANLLTKDEARRMAANFAKLPEWLRRLPAAALTAERAAGLAANPDRGDFCIFWRWGPRNPAGDESGAGAELPGHRDQRRRDRSA